MATHRPVIAAMLASAAASLLAVLPMRRAWLRAHSGARDAEASAESAGAVPALACLASTTARGFANTACEARPPIESRVSDGPPTMLHLDPRRTNRSAWTGPQQPKLAWTFDTGGPIEAAPALLDDGTIVVGSLGGTLHGIGQDGTSRFRVDLGNRVYSSPLVAGGGIYVGVDAGKFLALGPNGAIRWRLETDGDADTGAVPTRWGGIVFASGKRLYAVKSDGTLIWRVKARRKIFSSPAVAEDGTVFFGSQDHHVYAVLAEGKVLWTLDVGADVDCAPAVGDDGTVFVGTDGEEVLALGAADGSIRWRTRVGGFVRGSLSVRRDGTVLASTYGPRPRLVALSPDAGVVVFEFAVPGTGAKEFGIHGAPVEDATGRLYFGAQDDKVYALRADGVFLWSEPTHGDVDAPLVITPAGLLLAGSDDGTLYAFDEKSR